MDTTVVGRHIVFFSWRDTRNPEGGGAELYLEKVAAGLVARGAQVSIFCAAHDEAPRDEVVDGIRFLRRGSKTSVYARGLLALATRRFGRVDAIVDVQNGLPFFTRLVSRRPVTVLIHHVHREQWPVVYSGVVAKVGWWIESRLSPWLYRTSQYVAVSQATRDELVELGVDSDRIAIVHNGTDPALPIDVPKTDAPSVCTVGRLVPHKQFEHAVDACLKLRTEHPGLTLTVVGDGWWADSLHQYVQDAGAGDMVTFAGHVTEAQKQEIYARSWVMAMPSLKEGWGLVIGEAGMHGTPTVAYAAAGGTRESIADGESGLLADDYEELVAMLGHLLSDRAEWSRLSAGARAMSHRFTWGHAQGSFAQVVAQAMAGRREHSQDPEETMSRRGRG